MYDPTLPVAYATSGLAMRAAPVQQQPQAAPQISVAPVVVQKVSVEVTPARSDLLVNTEHWTWSELRDYVVGEIVNRFGPFPQNQRKEYGIFSRFFNDYGQDGIAVARYAFGPVCEGYWGSAPISVNRFCKNSDPYFVHPILERLRDIQAI